MRANHGSESVIGVSPISMIRAGHDLWGVRFFQRFGADDLLSIPCPARQLEAQPLREISH
jgi:hypothetical protein